ncbi:hypothetical protein LTR28_005854, partial [Elasticomyces elasticus]
MTSHHQLKDHSSSSTVGSEKAIEHGQHASDAFEDDVDTESITPAVAGQPMGESVLEKQISIMSAPSVNNVRSVPNGGLLAWVQVAGSFFLFFNS